MPVSLVQEQQEHKLYRQKIENYRNFGCLWAIHYSMARSFFLGELMNHHCSVRYDNLILIVQKFDELRNSPCSKISVILNK